MSEQLAVIKNGVSFGCRDVDTPVMWFTVYLDEGLASLQVIGWDEARKALDDAKIVDTKDLKGKACWVETDGNTTRFLRFWRDAP